MTSATQVCSGCARAANPYRMPTWLKWTLGAVAVVGAGTGLALLARNAAAKTLPSPSPSPAPGPAPAPAPAPAPEPLPEVLEPGINPVYTGETYELDSGTNKSVASIVWEPVTDQVSVDDVQYWWGENTSRIFVTILGPSTDATQILDVKTFADKEQTEPIAAFRLMMMNPHAS